MLNINEIRDGNMPDFFFAFLKERKKPPAHFLRICQDFRFQIKKKKKNEFNENHVLILELPCSILICPLIYIFFLLLTYY